MNRQHSFPRCRADKASAANVVRGGPTAGARRLLASEAARHGLEPALAAWRKSETCDSPPSRRGPAQTDCVHSGIVPVCSLAGTAARGDWRPPSRRGRSAASAPFYGGGAAVDWSPPSRRGGSNQPASRPRCPLDVARSCLLACGHGRTVAVTLGVKVPSPERAVGPAFPPRARQLGYAPVPADGGEQRLLSCSDSRRGGVLKHAGQSADRCLDCPSNRTAQHDSFSKGS